jgi:formylglycine-generating enzyme required for sulfatase activity
MSFGGVASDFSAFANLADYSIRNLAYEGWRPKSPDLAPRIAQVNDGYLVTAPVGAYKPNAWGLFDMHGNAAEWTRSVYSSSPGAADLSPSPGTPAEDGGQGLRVVRGGSWFDRPIRARSSFRQAYQPYQRVFNVGFRVVCE